MPPARKARGWIAKGRAESAGSPASPCFVEAGSPVKDSRTKPIRASQVEAKLKLSLQYAIVIKIV